MTDTWPEVIMPQCSTASTELNDIGMIFRKSFNIKDLRNGANGIRTHDLLHAMQALSHLSYGPDLDNNSKDI